MAAIVVKTQRLPNGSVVRYYDSGIVTQQAAKGNEYRIGTWTPPAKPAPAVSTSPTASARPRTDARPAPTPAPAPSGSGETTSGRPRPDTGTTTTTATEGSGRNQEAGTQAAVGTQTDYDFLAQFGLPGDLQAKVKTMLQGGYSVAEIIAYLRGTPWYAQTYPGIGEGIAKGLLGDERDYRAYLNQVNQLYTQYYQRPVTGQEIAGFLGQGLGVDTVGKQLQGEAYVNTYKPDIQFALGGYGEGQASGEQLTAYGRQQSGLSNPMGMKIQRSLDQAVARLQGVFQGRAATPIGLGLGSLGLSAPGLSRRRDDVAA